MSSSWIFQDGMLRSRAPGDRGRGNQGQHLLSADRIVAALGKIKVTRLSVPQVERFLKAMATRKPRPLSRWTVSATRGVLRLALRPA
jgi:hypothetical protein